MDTSQKLLDELSKYGLTEIQAKSYCSLLRLGKTSAMEIAKALSVHRSEVYRVLRQLEEKGIVTEHSGRPILFTPAPPEEALDILLQEQLKKGEYLEGNLPKMIDWLRSQTKLREIGPSVLLIDDDESIRMTLSHVLKGNGFDVDVAADGRQALEKARLRPYNIALIDIRLPDIEGTKLLKMLKKENDEIKQMIITGYPSIQNTVEALNEGADAYIIKPFLPSDLIAKMREVIKK